MEALPDDIISHIFSYNIGHSTQIFGKPLPFVDTTKHAEEAIQLGLSNDFFQMQFCRTMNYQLTVNDDTPFVGKLKTVFQHHIRDLTVETSRRNLSCLLTSPTLRHLTIRNFTKRFSLHNVSRSLQALYIHIDKPGRICSLENSISKLDLQELGISYGSIMSHEDFRIHQEVKQVTKRISLLNRRITTVAIQCTSDSANHRSWDIIKQFPNLKHVVLTENLPEEALHRMRKLDSVKIRNIPDGIKLATLLTEVVVSIDLIMLPPQYALRRVDIANLERCHTLAVLKARVLNGAEDELHRISRNFKELELEWVAAIMLPQSQYEDVPGMNIIPTNCALLRFATEAPLLTRLSLYGAAIPTEETKKILEMLGRRLTKFGISLEMQNVEGIIFVKELLDTLGDNNGFLQELNLRAEIFDTWTDLGVTGEVLVDKEGRRSLQRCLQRFHRRVPGVQLLYIRSLVNRMIRL